MLPASQASSRQAKRSRPKPVSGIRSGMSRRPMTSSTGSGRTRGLTVRGWLAQLPAPVRDALLDGDEQAQDVGVAEAIGAGFTHREAGRARRDGVAGFAAGGALDLLAPDPVLAGFADDAVRDGLAVLSDDELVGLLGAARGFVVVAGGDGAGCGGGAGHATSGGC
jgi:hypothetical protein